MPRTPAELLAAAVRQWEWAVIAVCGAAILVSVAIRFATKADAGEAPERRERSVVATVTMTAFFLALFVLARRGIGRLELTPAADLTARIVGSVLVVAGTVMNLAARVVIGRQWSDAIEIQRDHQLVRTWPYSWCRHPMYGSLVAFGAGLAVAARNPAALGAVLVLFVPAMVHRARREERLLVESLGEDYREFMTGSSRLIPRLPETFARPARGAVGVVLAVAAVARDAQVAILAALLVLGLSTAMARRDFRIAWKLKTAIVVGIALAGLAEPKLLALLWIPTAAAAMSLAGHCPGTLLLQELRKESSHGA